MTLFSLLLVLGWERLFKMGEHWQLDHRLEPLFRGRQRFSLPRTLLMTAAAMLLVWLVVWSLHGLLFGLLQLLFWIVTGLLCIGAGSARQHYHNYLQAASRDDEAAHQAMAAELTLIHGVPANCSEREFLRELQNALIWINFRFYLAPLFWFVVGGPVLLVGYAFLRAWQSWLARHASDQARAASGVDALLHVLDWIPVRLAGVAYALLGHGERALPAWFASLSDLHRAQYQVLTSLAQFSLARDPHMDKVATPRVAVALAKRTSLVLVVVVALLTIYGTLV